MSDQHPHSFLHWSRNIPSVLFQAANPLYSSTLNFEKYFFVSPIYIVGILSLYLLASWHWSQISQVWLYNTSRPHVAKLVQEEHFKTWLWMRSFLTFSQLSDKICIELIFLLWSMSWDTSLVYPQCTLERQRNLYFWVILKTSRCLSKVDLQLETKPKVFFHSNIV